jgi:hypothetical protein
MRVARSIAVVAVALTLLTAGCGDDDEVDTGPGASSDEGGSSGAAGTVPASTPDLVGEITTITPFVPVTEDCTPPEDLDPDDPVSSDDPPVCTPEDNDVVGQVLVEERPGIQEGRKISYTVFTSTTFAGEVRSFDDLAVGQAADTWVRGDVCAESYPEQCGLEAIRVTG